MRGIVARGHGLPLEVVGTVIEMADVAWNAIEHRRDRNHELAAADEAARLRSENSTLRGLLAENLALLQALSKSPNLSDDCPPDLYKRLVATVDDSGFLAKLESLRQESAVVVDGKVSSTKAAGDVDILFNDHGEPSWWVLVSQDVDPDSLEEVSEIDNENYIVVSEENVVDGIANFIARSILENPKSKGLTPEELQKTVTRALGDIKDKSKWKKVWQAGKFIYCMSTWGIALAGLYRHRAVLKIAAKGVHATGKIVMKAL